MASSTFATSFAHPRSLRSSRDDWNMFLGADSNIASRLFSKVCPSSSRKSSHDKFTMVPISNFNAASSSRSINSISSTSSIKVSFKNLQNEVIEMIHAKLMRSRFFSLHELLKEKSSAPKDAEMTEESSCMHLFNFSKMTRDDFIRLATEDKTESRALQAKIASADDHELNTFVTLVHNTLPELIVNAYGNYVVQQAVLRSNHLTEVVVAYCTENFELLAANEYSSRVMQEIANVCKKFRLHVFDWFSKHLHLAIDSVPAVFLLTSALSASFDPEEFQALTSLVMSYNSESKIFKQKLYKRVLISFLENCSDTHFDAVCSAYRVTSRPLVFLDDKFGALIMLTLIQRGHAPTLDCLCKLISFQMEALFCTKFFKFLFFKLAKENRSSKAATLARLNESLAKIPYHHLQKILEQKASATFFCFLVASTLNTNEVERLESIKSAVRNNGFERLLLHNKPACSASTGDFDFEC